MSTVGRTRAPSSVRPEPPAPAAEPEPAGLDAESAAALRLALRAARDGDFSVRLPVRGRGLAGELASEFNELVATNDRMARELVRVARIIGREGRMTERADARRGGWGLGHEHRVGQLADRRPRPPDDRGGARDRAPSPRATSAQKMALKIEGQPVKGEFLRIGTHGQHDGRSAVVVRRRGHAASRARSAPRASSAARPRSRASAGRGRT